MTASRIRQEQKRLTALLEVLRRYSEPADRVKVLGELREVREGLQALPGLAGFLDETDNETRLAVLAVCAIGQGGVVFRGSEGEGISSGKFQELIYSLLEIERFYFDMGGIIGYQGTVLSLLEKEGEAFSSSQELSYLQPPGYDVRGEEGCRWIRRGLECLPLMAEIYPVGGAGDRLGLVDEQSGEALPAAELKFLGRSLLTQLIRDVQAKEYLYFKLFDVALLTPIALMTSHEKQNHRRITAICKENEWFGRSPEAFFLFEQPLVPVVTKEGMWAMDDVFQPVLKPGGHGVIWKLAQEKGVFDWFRQNQRNSALLRQINNPIAGMDQGILALSGIGCAQKKAFGFASCERMLHAAEGMDVLVEHRKDGKRFCGITNIEYTEFAHKGIGDEPKHAGSRYSQFPSNTNILFADLKTVENALDQCPIPGMIINMKQNAPFIDAEGRRSDIRSGRLESTMQNIADVIVDAVKEEAAGADLRDSLRTFITFNERIKTISVTKRSYEPGSSLRETPEGCYYDLLKNMRSLLSQSCGASLPELCDEEQYLAKGPNIVIQIHPALGPLWSVIAQKIKGGRFADGSECLLEIAELQMEHLELEGSLLVTASDPLGSKGQGGSLKYGHDGGKCILRNVQVKNRGIERSADNIYWQNRIRRAEAMEICLQGNAEFVAENITFAGAQTIEVPHGFRWTAVSKEGGGIEYLKERIAAPTWHWVYSFDEEDRIVLCVATTV